jgi:hypothetical protein
MIKKLLLILCLLSTGCVTSWIDDLSGGYRYCEEHNLSWHTYYGEEHRCEWGAVVKDEK